MIIERRPDYEPVTCLMDCEARQTNSFKNLSICFIKLRILHLACLHFYKLTFRAVRSTGLIPPYPINQAREYLAFLAFTSLICRDTPSACDTCQPCTARLIRDQPQVRRMRDIRSIQSVQCQLAAEGSGSVTDNKTQ